VNFLIPSSRELEMDNRNFMDALLLGDDIIVWGYGHWALAKRKHWSVSAFVRDLQQKV
jgi:hypothetical protein